MGNLLAGAFMPHPPLIIPAVGGENCKKVTATIQAMKTLSERLVALQPDTVIITSPHGLHYNGAPTIVDYPSLTGSMEDFGVPDCRLSFPVNQELTEKIYTAAQEAGLTLRKLDENLLTNEPGLDSGAFVPLYYLREAGFSGKIVHITPGLITLADAQALGMLIADVVAANTYKTVFLGSGDLSHYLKDAAPYGKRAEGSIFDALVVDTLKNNDLIKLLSIDKNIAEQAGECGLRSLVCLFAAVQDMESEFYSYEGTFGVGYAVASWLPCGGKKSVSLPVRLARWVLEQHFSPGREKTIPPKCGEELSGRAGVFVSLKKHGRLRGCIGTFSSQYSSIEEEILHNAMAAAFSDPRFLPLSADEVDEVQISVDILSEPEEVTGEDELDAKKYGVIVARGNRRGLLLPDLDGVDSVAEQLAIAKEKAGLGQNEKVAIYRFKVTRYV